MLQYVTMFPNKERAFRWMRYQRQKDYIISSDSPVLRTADQQRLLLSFTQEVIHEILGLCTYRCRNMVGGGG